MNTAAISSLIGLVLEMAGAFLLATEAIGLDRIKSWREQWLETPIFILTAKRNEEMEQRAKDKGMQWFFGLTMMCSLGIAVAIAMFMSGFAESHGLSAWLRVPFAIVGLFVGAVFVEGCVFCMRTASTVLLSIEASAGRGAIGVTGFVLLSSGFVLQTLGVLPSIL